MTPSGLGLVSVVSTRDAPDSPCVAVPCSSHPPNIDQPSSPPLRTLPMTPSGLVSVVYDTVCCFAGRSLLPAPPQLHQHRSARFPTPRMTSNCLGLVLVVYNTGCPRFAVRLPFPPPTDQYRPARFPAPNVDVKGYANGPDSYWVRGMPLFDATACCPSSLSMAGTRCSSDRVNQG